jgi:hypothetical protein
VLLTQGTPPLMGSRLTIHLFGMVLIVLRSNVDRGDVLGRVAELLWMVCPAAHCCSVATIT